MPPLTPYNLHMGPYEADPQLWENTFMRDLEGMNTLDLVGIVEGSERRSAKLGPLSFLNDWFGPILYGNPKEAKEIIEQRKQARIKSLKAIIQDLGPKPYVFNGQGDVQKLLEMYQEGDFDNLIGHHVTIETRIGPLNMFNQREIAEAKTKVFYEPVAEKPEFYTNLKNRGLISYF